MLTVHLVSNRLSAVFLSNGFLRLSHAGTLSGTEKCWANFCPGSCPPACQEIRSTLCFATWSLIFGKTMPYFLRCNDGPPETEWTGLKLLLRHRQRDCWKQHTRLSYIAWLRVLFIESVGVASVEGAGPWFLSTSLSIVHVAPNLANTFAINLPPPFAAKKSLSHPFCQHVPCTLNAFLSLKVYATFLTPLLPPKFDC